jgi:hypothetical protein
VSNKQWIFSKRNRVVYYAMPSQYNMLRKELFV